MTKVWERHFLWARTSDSKQNTLICKRDAGVPLGNQPPAGLAGTGVRKLEQEGASGVLDLWGRGGDTPAAAVLCSAPGQLLPPRREPAGLYLWEKARRG